MKKDCPRFLIVFIFCLVCGVATAEAQDDLRSDPRSEWVLTAVSPDESTLAIARSNRDVVSRNGRVELWDLRSGELRKTINGFDGAILFVTFDPDGRNLITTSAEIRDSKIQSKPRDRSGKLVTEMKWWDSQSGDFVRRITLEGPGETVLSPDGSTFAVIRRDVVTAIIGRFVEPPGGPYEAMARRTGTHSMFESVEIKMYDSRTGEKKLKATGRSDAFSNTWGRQFVRSAFSPDGKLIAVASAREVRVWNAATGEKFQIIKKLEGTPLAIVFSPDSRSLAVASGKVAVVDRMMIQESEVTLWELSSATLIRKLRGTNDWVVSLHFSGNGKALLFGTLQYEPDRTVGTVKVWDFVTSRLATFNVHDGQKVSSVHLLSRQPGLVLQSGEDVEVRDTKTWRIRHSFEAKPEERFAKGASRFLLSVKQVVALSFLRDGTTVSGVVKDEGIRLWDSRTGGLKNELREVKIADGLVARSSNGRVLCEVGPDEIRVWDLSDGVQRKLPRSTSAPVSAVALSSNGQLLALGEGSHIRLRNITDEAATRSLTGHEDSIERLVFSDDGSTLASADESGAIKLWDVKTGQLRQTIATGNIVTALAVDTSGQLLASAGSDYVISIWNASTGASQMRLKKHENVINALAFSFDGKTLASGGDDRVAVVWDLLTGKSKHTLKGHDLTVTSLAFSREGQLLATGSGNASVVLWNVMTGKLDRILR